MSARHELESAIMDVEGSMSVMEILEGYLFDSLSEGWRILRLEPQDDRYVFVMSPREYGALSRAITALRTDLKSVSDAFAAYRP